MEQENKFFSWLENNLMGPLSKMAQFKIVRAIMGAGVAAIPFTIVGSMFLVLNVLPTAIPALQGIFDTSLGKISPLYMLANTATMGILALYFNLVLGYEYTKIYAEEDDLDLNPLNGALLSMFAFFMSIPVLVFADSSIVRVTEITDASTIVNGWIMGGDGVARLGTAGIFTGIIMAIIAVQLYRLCVAKQWVIKMPEGVPDGVTRSFTALVPAFVIAFVVIIINGILIALGTDIFTMIEVPFGFVTNIANSWLGVVVIFFFIHLLWLVGIHGTNTIIPMLQPILLGNLALNAQEGQIVPFAGAFAKTFVEIGGSGATLGAVIIITFFAKSQQLKSLGKAAIIPSIFNINEPVIFGLPIIYNPYLAIPFIVAPMINVSLSYWAIKLGFISPIIAQAPWPTPVGISAFIGTGGDWRSVVLALLLLGLSTVIYYPFIRAYDQKLLQQEMEISEA